MKASADLTKSNTENGSRRGAGRFAPSPTGEFHLGNMRTALLAWALARATGRAFYIRMEDLDERSRAPFAKRQLEDLETLGIQWDGPVVYQHQRLVQYERAVEALAQAGMLYECYCTRKELAQAASAPHATPGFYPGTCRNLSEAERQQRRASLQGRGPALRLKVARGYERMPVWDEAAGSCSFPTDDIVIRRGDGVYSYNFVSVLDDALMGIDQIVRGDDLLSSTGRQSYLLQELSAVLPELASWHAVVQEKAEARASTKDSEGGESCEAYGACEGSGMVLTYAHVPLVLNMQGQRLAKRDGAVTLRALHECGWEVADVIELIGLSLGFEGVRTGDEFLAACESAWATSTGHMCAHSWLAALRGPWRLDVTALASGPGTPSNRARIAEGC